MSEHETFPLVQSWGYDQQIRVHDKLLRSRGGIIWWKVGQGKTRPAVKLFESMTETYKWPFPTICVVVLRRAAFLDFRRELIKLDIDAVVLEDDLDCPEAVQIATTQKPTYLLVSSAMLPKSVDSLLVDPRVRFAIIDELHLYKNPKAARSIAVRKLVLHTKAVGLSGSIVTAQKMEDIYGQLMAVHKERYVAPNMTKFKSEYLNMKMQGKKGGKQWPFRFPKPGSWKRLMESIKDCTDVYYPKNKDRKITMQSLEVESTPEQAKAFADLKKWMEVDLGNGKFLELNNALQVVNKISQISNGWLTDAEGGMHEIPSNKYDRLANLGMELMESGEQLVIWCAYREDVRRIVNYFEKKHGIAALQFMSGEPFRDDLWQSGRFPIVVATEAMGSSVNHFEQVAYACYFSMNYKWLDLQQSMGRHDRYASKHAEVFYYFMQVAGSMDEAIYNRVLASRDREKLAIIFGEELNTWLRRPS